MSIRSASAAAFKLERELSVAEWADEHRLLSSISSSMPGPWRTSRTPYLREIMDLLSPEHACEDLCFMKGAQIGGTEVLLNWVGYVMENTPGPMLIVQPTQDLLKKFSKQRLSPAIEGSPGMRELVTNSDGVVTLFTIEYQGGILMMTTARSASGLSSMPIRFLGCDEVDRYPGDLDGEGDPIELAKRRTATFAGRKRVYVSTPKLRGVSRIEQMYEASDKRRYFIPCPHCNHFDVLTWTGFIDYLGQQDPGHHRIGWEEDNPAGAFMVCGGCNERVDESHKPVMLERGEWRATSPGPGKMPGFHLSALYSPLGWYSWGQAATEFLTVKDKPEQFQTWVNTTLGEAWEQRGDSVGWKALQSRCEAYPETKDGDQLIPNGVGILVAGVDIQADRIEWVIYGFGHNEESWLIAFGAEPGDPAAPAVWIELDQRLQSFFQHQSGRMMPIDCVAIDSNYQTEEVFKFCQVRLDSGRRIYPVRGGAEVSRPFVASPSRTNAYKVPLYNLCTDTGKAALYSRFLLRDVGPGFIHFPNWVSGDDEFFQQLTAEKAIRKWQNGRSARVWHKIRHRNEQLDMALYALAALYIRGNGRAPTWLKSEAEEWAKPPDGPQPVMQPLVPKQLSRRPSRWMDWRR